MQRRVAKLFPGEKYLIRTTTTPTIACLVELDAPECQVIERKRPLFAPNLMKAKPKRPG